MLAFTEDLKDCLLCPLSYFIVAQCVTFATRKPYPIIQTFTVDSWEAALTKASCLRDEFATTIQRDETLP